MRLTARIRVQLALFLVISVISAGVLFFGYLNVPSHYFNVDRYTVDLDLPEAGGLYPNANVMYRGTNIGRVRDISLTPDGIRARLLLDSGTPIPRDVDAAVHSVSAAGEQYVSLTPRNAHGPMLADGDVITADRGSVQPDVNTLLDATNRGLTAIPHDNLKTAVDESYIALAGLGPELSRIVNGSTALATDAADHLDSILTLIDHSEPVLTSQSDTGNDIAAWSAHLADITGQLRSHDQQVSGILQNAGPAFEEARALVDRLRPTLPILMANLVTVGQVALTYQPALEQLLVLLPPNIAAGQAISVPNLTENGPYKGIYLDLALNLNLPPVCNTGFLPPQQRRTPAQVDAPPRPQGDLYCRVPQDAPFNIRGARNYPCLSVPGKRAPTVKMCESNESFVPLNDGYNWKGDPNATLSGQDVPQPPASSPGDRPTPPPPPVPIAVAEYDPTTGEYVGADGTVYRQSDIVHTPGNQTWQTMLMPPP